MEINRKVRSKKLNTRVDLTAMVSVSFLLIVFFMVTTELTKPKIMALSLPEKDPAWDGVIRCGAGIDYRVITVLLDDKDKIITYSGLLGYSDKLPKEFKYGVDGIHKELLNKKNKIQEYTGDSNRGPIVIIKPSKKCNFKNLVDILDEMAISKIDTYAIVNEFTPEEYKLLAYN
ncbi:biopolymer transporter ExbD [Flavobacterium cheongpyeongense]|uniref:Biopolymer transporter ExbD n=1 Tax=Flavobacterium cheongpyeongense TaxID=2212651 RepID=A0A2V4BK50_9FLAO|nr:biopolymer transporter ExbD [Flavobacterium cheongpyeongense]PXY39345.1 biopolymer transporter ExbD [Flavobacterium cheongpyeongense]